MKYPMQNVKLILVVGMLSFWLAGCSGGDTSAESELALSQDTQFAYVERSVEQSAKADLERYKARLVSYDQAPLDVDSPYDLNVGAKLVLQSSMDADAERSELLSAYFGSSDYDIKDLNISPDGRSLIFAAHGGKSHPTDYTWNIYTYDLESKTIRRVIADHDLANAGMDTSPTITAGGVIVFSTDRAAGNPDSPVDNIVDESDGENCYKVSASEKPSLLHSMQADGSDIKQLTYGNNHDLKTLTLSDGNVAFVRWSRSYELVKECTLDGVQKTSIAGAEYDQLFSSSHSKGFDKPESWDTQALCEYAIDTPLGAAIATNHYTLLRISPDGAQLDQLYATVSLGGSDEAMLNIAKIKQMENGKIVALLEHGYNPLQGGSAVELQAPSNGSPNQVFGELAPVSILDGDVDLYPNQASVKGWVSSYDAYKDNSGRVLLSWAQCAVVDDRDISSFCDGQSDVGDIKTHYGLWVIDRDRKMLPITLARRDVVYSDIAVAEAASLADYPFEPYKKGYVDNLDSARIICDDPSVAPVSPTDPASPPAPVGPGSPTDPSNPPAPTGPADPTSPPAPTGPTDPSNPPAPTGPAGPTDPTDPTGPTNPSDPVNRAPTANAGPDQAAQVNGSVVLDGSASSDPDGDPLTYQWSIVSASTEGGVELNNSDESMSSLGILSQGTYVIRLIVNDGKVDSLYDDVTVEVGNIAPVANAGADQSGYPSDTFTLDGSGSTDADGDSLSFSWSLVSGPEGSLTQLSDPAAVMPTVTPDDYGVYTYALIVDDGTESSEADYVVIDTSSSRSDNQAPVANAGDDQSAYPGEFVTLDGSASADPDGDDITYSWSLLSRPEGSEAALSAADLVTPMLQLDEPGSYVVQLLVNDGVLSSEPDTVVITTENARPIANAGQAIETSTEVSEVVLDGSASYDPDGDSLSYSWSFVSQPEGVNVDFVDATVVKPQFPVSVGAAGIYVAQLIVSDGELSSEPSTVTIDIKEAAFECDYSDDLVRPFPAIIRDFKEEHPDFQYMNGSDKNIVTMDLGEDGKPVYAHGEEGTFSTNGPSTFNQWYRDVEGVNITTPMQFLMTREAGSTVWTYENSFFFPIDGMSWGNEGHAHNYHFTLEAHLSFDYKGGEVFTFTGDDDLWVYINGKRVIDLGGVHSALSATVVLDEVADYLGIEPGNTYSFDLFFAERHLYASNFKFQTNIDLDCIPR